MRQSGGGFAPGYNVQISTDAAHWIVVAVEATRSANDYEELKPAVERIKQNVGQVPGANAHRFRVHETREHPDDDRQRDRLD